MKGFFPKAKFALIERDIIHVKASCMKLFGDDCHKEIDALVKVHNDLRKRDDIKKVDFERLNHAGVLHDLQRWLTPKVDFDFSRYELLNGLQIEFNAAKYLENAK